MPAAPPDPAVMAAMQAAAHAFFTEVFALLGVGLLVIFVRTGARIHSVGFRGLMADDYLMLVAAVSNLLPKRGVVAAG